MEQDLEKPLLLPKSSSGNGMGLVALGCEDHRRSVSTHRQTVWTPLTTGFRTSSGRDSECRHTGRLCRHHWQTVLTHRQTVSTPLATFLQPVHWMQWLC
ncbi:hypothetical protein Taro_052142 [Colocasia esculenta]|uniref:Uncharacterized protein n=1 Tax=Colocasia esculenta TaxID=4460 RepID=A0A843XIS4_COLES|nr:hypothetical protein [Colocasia esculenta]